MPTPSPSWDLVRVYATWNNLDGTKKGGAYTVTIPQRVTSATDDVIIPPGVYASGKLNAGSGPSLDLMVPTTNDPDVSPQNWSITVSISFDDKAPSEVFNISPSITGGPINLRTVVLPSNALPLTDVLIRGVSGGVAGLDRDGDVVDAAGTKVKGGTGGTGGSISSAQITDATPTGRNVLSAASADAARQVISAQRASAITTVTGAGTGRTLSVAQNYYDLTLNAASCAIALPLGTSTTPFQLTLVLRQDSVGGRAVTFEPPPTWLGSAPTYETAPGGVTVLSLFSTDGGNTWFGTKIGSVAGTAPQTAVLPQTTPFTVRSA